MAKKRRKLNKDFEREIYSSTKNVELVLAKIYDIDDEDIQKEYMSAFNRVVYLYDGLKENYEAKKMNPSEKSKNNRDKSLPWWVELLFVQIGLPDKLLIKILKTKKTSKEFIKNEKKSIIIFLFVITTLAYFYPVIKHAKNKLDCEAIAKNYIIKNKNIIEIDRRE